MSKLKRPRKVVLALTTLAFAVAGSLVAGRAVAQANWPDRPIRVVVPYAAGQGADVLARLIMAEVQKSFKQPIVIDNRAGAGANIGTAHVAQAAPDGYTFLHGTNATHAANEFLYSSTGFHPIGDFEPVAMVGLLPMVITTSAQDLSDNAIAQLIEKARSAPDTLNVGIPSTTANVVFAKFVADAQAPLFGVRYGSSGQSMTDMIGGQIPLAIDTVTASRPHILAGKIKALGITSLKPSSMLPGVQPVADQGVPGFDIVAWNAYFAPKGTPKPIIEHMSAAIHHAVENNEVRQRMLDSGVEPFYLDADALGAFVLAEREKWGATIQQAGIRLE